MMMMMMTLFLFFRIYLSLVKLCDDSTLAVVEAQKTLLEFLSEDQKIRGLFEIDFISIITSAHLVDFLNKTINDDNEKLKNLNSTLMRTEKELQNAEGEEGMMMMMMIFFAIAMF
jgi:hypothetical protein